MIDDLIADSQASRLLWESRSFRDRRLSAEEAAEATKAIEAEPDYSRYHLLLALRRDFPAAYRGLPAETRARVLADALAHQTVLNDFGLLMPRESTEGEAARALLESGDGALKPLRPLLDDDRPAPSHGSEEGSFSRMYGLRRNDYAYRFLALLTGADAEFHPELELRDQQIDGMRRRLSAEN